MQLTIPNVLTLIRLVFSPIILPLLIVSLLPSSYLLVHYLVALIFVGFALTDFLDGYLARMWGQTSKLGRLLDPIADKFLTCSTLIALLAIHRIHVLWVLLLVGRELWVMGIREIASEQHFSIHVSIWGKFKTICQMAYLAVVIANPYYAAPVVSSSWNVAEVLLLIFSLILSLGSAWSYHKSLMCAMETNHHS
jgi:CDP-diacylglycerol--glycerol-3-phosphate 3-phosphatidyltransferase